MAAYMTYWPGDQLRALKKAGDTGPIKVVLGSIHTKMPSVDSLQVGDIIYPVSVIKGTLCVLARLPVEKKESAFDYLIRETGQRYAALIPSGVACREEGIRGNDCYITHDRIEIPGEPGKYRDLGLFDNPEELPEGYRIVDTTQGSLPHLLHQEPFNCCSKTAVSGTQGSTIEPRPIPRELLPELRFGWPKSKQKGLRFNAKGDVLTMCVATTRRLSDETFAVFESLFSEPEAVRGGGAG